MRFTDLIKTLIHESILCIKIIKDMIHYIRVAKWISRSTSNRKIVGSIPIVDKFKDIFKKSNDYNEKVIIGFLSFMVMVIAITVDLVTGYLGRALELNEYIFDSFMYITLGSFLPDVIEKFANLKGGKKSE